MKRWVILVLIVVVLLLSINLWFLFRKNKAYQQKGPAQTSAILAVNVDDLLWKIFKNRVSSPSLWFSGSKSSSDSDPWEKHIDIPAVIFVYTSNNFPNSVFTSVPINHKDHLITSLTKRFGVNWNHRADLSYFISDTEHEISWIIAGNTLYAGFVQPSDTSMEGEIREFVNETKNQVLLNSYQESVLNQEGELITLLADSTLLTADFNDQLLHFKVRIPENNKNSDLPFLKKFLSFKIDETLEKHIASVESFSLSIQGTVTHTDSVISYQFDDNFERTETMTITQDTLPGVSFSFEGDFDAEFEAYAKQTLKFWKIQITESTPQTLEGNNRYTLEQTKAITGRVASQNNPAYAFKIDNIDTINEIHIEGQKDQGTWVISGNITFQNDLLEMVIGK